MKKFLMNYSDEEYLPSECGIFIKRFSNFKDDAFPYAVSEFLENAKFEGICYVGEERGKIPFEYFDQDYWEKSVIFNAKCVIIFVSGNDYDLDSEDINDLKNYACTYEGTRHQKFIASNANTAISGSDLDYSYLNDLIEVSVKCLKNELM